MKAQLTFNLKNKDFDQEYADEFHLGQESDGNIKYKWSVTYSVQNVTSVEFIKNGVYQLKVKLETEEQLTFQIENVFIFRCHLENGSYDDFAVSKSLVNKAHQTQDEKLETIRTYFYIDSEPNSVEVVPGLIICEGEIPDGLLIKS